MNIHIDPDIEADITQMFDKSGTPHAVVVIKQCFSIPLNDNEQPKPLAKNWSLFYEDIFVDEPGISPTLFENDFVLKKQKCDIVVNAKAYSTQAQAKEASFLVGFRVNDCNKTAEVTNEQSKSVEKSQTEPVWLHYGSTWGGTWQTKKQETVVFTDNPVGKGYVPKKYQDIRNNATLPAVLYPNTRSGAIDPETLQPCAFSTLARNATPRLGYAGTYDDTWYNEVFPLLPTDFDERFFQCVPEDQQIPFPVGGEIVKFISLHPTKSRISFNLPTLMMPVVLKDAQANLYKPIPVVDTIQFDLEKQEFALVWRCQHPLKRSLREIEVAIIGNIDQATCEGLLDCAGGGCGDTGGEPCCGGCAEGEECEGDDTAKSKHKHSSGSQAQAVHTYEPQA